MKKFSKWIVTLSVLALGLLGFIASNQNDNREVSLTTSINLKTGLKLVPATVQIDRTADFAYAEAHCPGQGEKTTVIHTKFGVVTVDLPPVYCEGSPIHPFPGDDGIQDDPKTPGW